MSLLKTAQKLQAKYALKNKIAQDASVDQPATQSSSYKSNPEEALKRDQEERNKRPSVPREVPAFIGELTGPVNQLVSAFSAFAQAINTDNGSYRVGPGATAVEQIQDITSHDSFTGPAKNDVAGKDSFATVGRPALAAAASARKVSEVFSKLQSQFKTAPAVVSNLVKKVLDAGDAPLQSKNPEFENERTVAGVLAAVLSKSEPGESRFVQSFLPALDMKYGNPNSYKML